MTAVDHHASLLSKLKGRQARAGVVGPGYVGLPLGVAIVRAGYSVSGFDVDPEKVTELSSGRSYISTIPSEGVAEAIATGRFEPIADFSRLGDCDYRD